MYNVQLSAERELKRKEAEEKKRLLVCLVFIQAGHIVFYLTDHTRVFCAL
jgi:hypothetical protein